MGSETDNKAKAQSKATKQVIKDRKGKPDKIESFEYKGDLSKLFKDIK